MAGARQEGPVCAYGKPVVVDDGTSCRAPTPRPGSVDSVVHRYFVTVGEFLDSDYQTLKASLQSTYEGLDRGLRANYEGARCLYQASRRAEELAPGAVLRETGYELQSLLAGLIPGLLQMIVVVGATTFLGATIGGIVGFFFGGVGAVPGAAVGGEIGFDVGLAFLTWLGVAFLAVSIAKGFGEMVGALQNGIDLAWRACNLQGSAEEKQVEQAALELARTVGILVRLILQAVVAYLLKKAAVRATRGAMTTAGALRAEGAAAVSDATVAELVGKLRASKFGPGFADWVEHNWRDLVKDPRLRITEKPTQVAGPAGRSEVQASVNPKSNVKGDVESVVPEDNIDLAKAIRKAPKGSPERARLIDEFASRSTHGEPAQRVVLGKWEETGRDYRTEAKEHGGIYYETPPDTFPSLGPEAAWETNEAFLRQQMKAEVPKIEFVNVSLDDIASELEKIQATGQPLSTAPGRVKEFLYLQDNATKYGYVQQGITFVKQ